VSLVITIDRGSVRRTVLPIVEGVSTFGGNGVTFLPMDTGDLDGVSALLPGEELFSEIVFPVTTYGFFAGSDFGMSATSVFGEIPAGLDSIGFGLELMDGSLRGTLIRESPRVWGVVDETVVDFATGSTRVEFGAVCLRPPG
jgi:hypothetical protein